MTGFSRAIHASFRYKWSLIASAFNALVIGALWGVSITTVYPIVEVVLQGQTIESWFDAQIKQSKQAVDQSVQEIATLQEQPATVTEADSQQATSRIAIAKSRKVTEEKWLAFFEGVQPYISGRIPSTAFGTLAMVMVLFALATVTKGICLVLETVLVARVANRTILDMRRQFFRSALEMDQRMLDAHGTSSLMSQIVHNTNVIGEGLETLYGTSVREPLKALACLIGAAAVSWQLLILSLLLAPAGVMLVHYLAIQTRRVAVTEFRGMATILDTIMETLNGIKIVKIYNRERAERQRFEKDTWNLYKMGMRVGFYDAIIKPVTEMCGIVTIVLAILVGAHLVLNQYTHLWGIRICARPLSPGALLLFYAMLAGIADPARKMSDIYTKLVRASSACDGLYGVFEAKPGVIAPPNPKPVPLHSRGIRFENVSFSYVPGRCVLDSVDFEIPFGQTIALVGANGCGKSTILNLLARFYDPQQGAVLIDGIDVREVRPKKLRRQMAMVTQDPFLFHGTVRENIAYGMPSATEQQILSASKKARVDDFISSLASGYDTQVGDRGNALSGGQRQRVALARAILKDPRILVLDEATSQIDEHSEELVHETLREFLGARTTILVTHRASTICLAQRVIMMDRGRIVGDVSVTDYFSRYTPVDFSVSKAG